MNAAATPTPAPPKVAARQAARRDEIVREAARLFDERGYHATSMEDLADTVGIAKPTLYHYFRSKDEILHSIHDAFIELLIRRHELRLADSQPADRLLLAMMADILELMETHRGHVRVFFEHHRELAAHEHAEIAAKRERYETMARETIRRGVDDGILRAGLDVELTTLAMFGMCNWAYQWYRPSGRLGTDEIARVLWDLLLHGAAAAPAR